jgi:hypothetical protein
VRDSLVQATKALTGATTVTGNSIGLGADATKHAVGGPVLYGYEFEVYYPSTPTGTTPTVKCMLQDSLDDSTFVDCALIHNTEAAASTTYPRVKPNRFFVRKGAKSVRPSWTLGNADNDYGTVTYGLNSGGSGASRGR